MPSEQKLSILTDLREKQSITLTQMAEYCGLSSRRGRESVSKWERGISTPRAMRRAKIVKYLCQHLRLNADRLQEIWNILIEEWHWDPLNENELQQCITIQSVDPLTGSEVIRNITGQPTTTIQPKLLPSPVSGPSGNVPNTHSNGILIVTVTKVEAQAVLTIFSQAAGKDWIRWQIGDKTYYDSAIPDMG